MKSILTYSQVQESARTASHSPRYSDEENNTETRLNTSQWSSTTSVSVSDSDGETAAGVPSVTIATDGSFSAGTTGNAEYTLSDPSTSDVEKRYLQSILNVDSLESGAVVDVQVRDGDATVTLTGPKVQKKFRWDFGEERVLGESET